MKFLIYVQNLTIIGPVVSEITSLIKMDTGDRQSDGRKRKATFFVPTLAVMKHPEGIKVAIRRIDSITILSLRSGSKNATRYFFALKTIVSVTLLCIRLLF